MKDQVQAWVADIVIPTYPIGKPEKNPMFLEKRIYQGSSGVVYPHAVVEQISDELTEKTYQAVFLENQYLKIMVLPALGGRIQMAFDKVKSRHFIYYNQVIKPALVGLTGPWISGGIEFNWPQHHRPSTFEPIDFCIKENKDGSKTIWVNEVERMFRTKGMAGFTLYPGKAYIEISGRLYNRTPFPQTFLWWANPAVKVNEHYQSVFPPDVHAVFDHGKRDVSSFPIAKGEYYKVDYSPGTDISWYKNIPVPTSFMAVASKYNFIGGYEHDSGGGLLHVADHHLSPGKKQWTWGHGDFGKAWDKNLTDEDGPYIELMTGVYTDNQPDFSWLQPYEEKTFKQYFLPYAEVGLVKNASKDAVMNLEVNGNQAVIKLYVTAAFDDLEIVLRNHSKILFTACFSASPASLFQKEITLPEAQRAEELLCVLFNKNSRREMLRYQQEAPVVQAMPMPAKAAVRPREMTNNEMLYLAGLHLEQYRHATFSAQDYYEEALRRDAGDARCNNALGLWWLRRAQFVKAEAYFRKAIETLTGRNPNPYDGEAYYNLGWCLQLQGRYDEAFEAFYKAVWNDAWQHAGYLNLARIASRRSDFEEALELVEKSMVKNWNSQSARHVKAFILRHLGQPKEALLLIEDSLAIDPFNFGCLFEKYVLLQSSDTAAAFASLEYLKTISRNWVHNFFEYALDYAHAGLYSEAIKLLSICDDKYALIPYYKGWFALQIGEVNSAKSWFAEGAKLSPDFVFPNRIEEVIILQAAIAHHSGDAKAAYYLGNCWYDKRQYAEAIQCWEQSIQWNNGFATVHRNLALAYFNKRNDAAKALQLLEKAFSLDTSDARVLMELDQLYKRLNKPHHERLELLEQHLLLVLQRDDLYLERITLYNQLGHFQTAKDLMAAYKFHPWEGGEGKVVGQYLVAHIELAKQAIRSGQLQASLALLCAAESYPANLGEGKLNGAQENDIFYWKGVTYEQLGEMETALHYFQMATTGISQPVQAIFYNDPQPDKILYQGLAWHKLDEPSKAIEIFERLIAFGNAHINDEISIDYFAVSLPDLLVFDADLSLRNKIHCLYLQGLGYLGLGNASEAIKLFDEVMEMDANHQGALVHRQWAQNL